jgi:tRNA pseudouridine38-40 synthase
VTQDAVRLRLDLAYDGTDFHGWAAQPGLRTVQGTLEGALAAVLRVPSAGLTCAGRTDAGVHARGQVCHADVARAAVDALGTSPPYDGCAVLRRRLAGVLPSAIRVGAVREAAVGFDARFSALQRRYVYRVCDDPAALDPLTRAYVLAWRRPLDVDAMQSAADRLIGEHDFAAFCRAREGATTIRHLRELTWTRVGAVLEAQVRADAFCHSMVRALVGACLAVGEGRLDPAAPAAVLVRRERDSRLPVVAAQGLTLEGVDYPPDEELAARAVATRRRRVPDGIP